MGDGTMSSVNPFRRLSFTCRLVVVVVGSCTWVRGTSRRVVSSWLLINCLTRSSGSQCICRASGRVVGVIVRPSKDRNATAPVRAPGHVAASGRLVF